MFHEIRFGGLALLVVGILALSTVHCECDPGGVDCVFDVDCESDIWNNEYCDEADGHWECNAGLCESVCDDLECTQASDCEINAWPGVAGCVEADGHWECNADQCEAVCDPVSCTQASDCDGEAWPGNAGCVEANGHWECNADQCEAVCDPVGCTQASDCDGEAWPGSAGCVEANGHWECNADQCEAVCDPVGCMQASDCDGETWPASAGCDQADGHWECNADLCEAVCDPPECAVYQDCVGNEWPAAVDCPITQGHWECPDGVCLAVCNLECDQVLDCPPLYIWDEPCTGYFACVQGLCEQVCDDVTCSDGVCNEAGGETDESCPVDCDPPCAAAADCVDRDPWELPCMGRWECKAEACLQVCDYDSCEDGVCDAAAGEDGQSCPADCLQGCQVPMDCAEEAWGQMCQGHWNCFMGDCVEVCESFQCGNDICNEVQGETEDNCFLDCLGGPCHETADCFVHRWYPACAGHWECNAGSSACEGVCESDTCGDGICEPIGGETPVSCATDCQSYQCSTDADCSGLTLPPDCAGTWICAGLSCFPVCPVL